MLKGWWNKMTDREELIQALKCCMESLTECVGARCPYFYEQDCCTKVMKNNALILLEKEEEQPRWIPVKEKLPEDSSDCLVYNGSQVQFCSYYCGTWNTPDCYESETIDGVTHWMPLPKPPEGESE